LAINDDIVPSEFLQRLLQDPELSDFAKNIKFQSVQRILPVDYLCFAGIGHLCQLFNDTILPRYFPIRETTTTTTTKGAKEQSSTSYPTFKLDVRVLNNHNIKKEEVIDAVAKLVPSCYKVSLGDAELVVLIELVKVSNR
jgi:hypothetical protein